MYPGFFGIFRIVLGVGYLLIPAYPLFTGLASAGDERNRIYFTFLFFLAYAYSAITNGLREIRRLQPAFSLLRFFELAMNGFISLYLVILFATSGVNLSFRLMMLVAALMIAFAAIRDSRIIGRQFAERKSEMRKQQYGKK